MPKEKPLQVWLVGTNGLNVKMMNQKLRDVGERTFKIKSNDPMVWRNKEYGTTVKFHPHEDAPSLMWIEIRKGNSKTADCLQLTCRSLFYWVTRNLKEYYEEMTVYNPKYMD